MNATVRSRLAPAVQALWDLIEEMHKKHINWIRRPDSGPRHELGSRFEVNGTPQIAYTEDSIIDDKSVSHELLHLWRFGLGVPVINASLNRSLEGRLSNIQNHFEHLWIYSIQEAKPFNMHPWNKPNPRDQVLKGLNTFHEGSGQNLSWGIAAEERLSRPVQEHFFRTEVSKVSRLQIAQADQILKEWTFGAIDTPHGAAASYVRVLEIIEMCDIEQLQWQRHDGLRAELVAIDCPFPGLSASQSLLKGLADKGIS